MMALLGGEGVYLAAVAACRFVLLLVRQSLTLEEFDTERVFGAEDLGFAPFNQDVQRLHEYLVVHAVEFCPILISTCAPG